MNGLYLLFLVVSLAGLAAIDHHHKLVFFKDAKRAIRVFAIALAAFIAWDIVGIVLDIFFIGETDVLTGLRFGPEFPIEELFFLSLLIYTPLIIHRFLVEEGKA